MKLAWYNKILCLLALATLFACGGDEGFTSHGKSISFPLKLVNNSGATALFTPANGSAISVPAGSSHTTTGVDTFGATDNSNVWSCDLKGGGGEQKTGNVTVFLTDKISLMTVTWDDVNVTITKQL